MSCTRRVYLSSVAHVILRVMSQYKPKEPRKRGLGVVLREDREAFHIESVCSEVGSRGADH